MTSEADKPNGSATTEHGITRESVPTLIITLDRATLMVHLNAGDVKMSVAQMMLDEVQRQLEIQRRQAAAIDLQKHLADAARTAALLGSLGSKR